MKKSTVAIWVTSSLLLSLFLTACGQEDNNSKSNGSKYVEINQICFNTETEMEVSYHRCEDSDAPIYETSGYDCYRVDDGREKRVSSSTCDPYWDEGLGGSISSRGQCDGLLYYFNGFQMQPVDCRYNDCRGYTLYRDASGSRTVTCN